MCIANLMSVNIMLCLGKMLDNIIFVIMSGATISDKLGKQAGDSWDRVAPYLFSDASDGSVAGRGFPLGYPLEKESNRGGHMVLMHLIILPYGYARIEKCSGFIISQFSSSMIP